MNIYSRPLKLSEESRKDYAGLFLLDLMVSESKVFSLLPSIESKERELSPILERLLFRGEVEIHEHEFYRPTEKGLNRLDDFIDLYDQHIDYLDYFSAVDLELGEFAYASADAIEDDDEWEEFLYHERFSDLRLAYAEFNNINPFEALFYSYWCDENFAFSESTWQVNELMENIWNEIAEILEHSSSLQELTYHDDSGCSISATQVMQSLIDQVDLFLQNLDGDGPEIMDDEFPEGPASTKTASPH